MRVCAACKTETADLKRCVQCLKVFYCSPSYQRADWKTHKATCKAAAAAAAAAASPPPPPPASQGELGREGPGLAAAAVDAVRGMSLNEGVDGVLGAVVTPDGVRLDAESSKICSPKKSLRVFENIGSRAASL